MRSAESSAWLCSDDLAGHVVEIAQDLVGRTLRVVAKDGRFECGRIIETEAYGGPEDLASHASFRPGGRAAIMWNDPGLIYVYAAYGIYPCLNIVVGPQGVPSAVLIRGVWVNGDARPTVGPGRVARRLGIHMEDQGESIDGSRIAVSRKRCAGVVEALARVGITRDVSRLWRFKAAPLDVVRQS